jgi:hypothetical protein
MERIQNWQDIVDNLRQFQYVLEHNSNKAFERFSQFYHWYYFPADDQFAPSKFLGYKGSTISNYEGKGDGGETQRALQPYFYKLAPTDPEYTSIEQKLLSFAGRLNKKINSKTFEGTGGIYLPNNEFVNVSAYTKELYDTSSKDIEGMEAEEDYQALEGGSQPRLVNHYERNAVLRSKAIAIHGTKCKACEFDFKATYGKHGEDYIEVHHLKLLSKLVVPTMIDPKTDMTVLCSNCHRMVHRNKNNVLSVDELIRLIKRN